MSPIFPRKTFFILIGWTSGKIRMGEREDSSLSVSGFLSVHLDPPVNLMAVSVLSSGFLILSSGPRPIMRPTLRHLSSCTALHPRSHCSSVVPRARLISFDAGLAQLWGPLDPRSPCTVLRPHLLRRVASSVRESERERAKNRRSRNTERKAVRSRSGHSSEYSLRDSSMASSINLGLRPHISFVDDPSFTRPYRHDSVKDCVPDFGGGAISHCFLRENPHNSGWTFYASDCSFGSRCLSREIDRFA